MCVSYKPFHQKFFCRNMQRMKTRDFVVPGIGVDVVDVERMKLALERTPRIRKRLFTEGEITYCEKFRFAERHYAGRWAAKEAVTKALGCGLIQCNGVDGFVVARALHRAGVEVAVLPTKVGYEGDPGTNFEILRNLGVRFVRSDELEAELNQSDLIIDALLGTGFSGEVREKEARL